MDKVIGEVLGGEQNRYWEFPIVKDKAVGNVHKIVAKLYWIAHVIGILAYCIFLYVYLYVSTRRAGIAGKYTEKALRYYKEFLDIYPTSIYPLVVKAYELAFYDIYSMEEPSLELGTGDGYFTSRLYKNRKNKVTIASDLTGSTLLQAERKEFYRKLAIIDAMNVALPDNCLSTIIMNNLIHHLPDRGSVLAEMHRILMPNGIFLFTDEYSGWATSQWHIRFKPKSLDKFLKQTIQCLLIDKKFYGDMVNEGWEVVGAKDFFSNKSMYLTSVLESLNHKMGSPTPVPIMSILNKFKLLKRFQIYLTSKITEALIFHDYEFCNKYGATCVFMAMKKKNYNAVINDADLSCPDCKGKLLVKDHASYCYRCNKYYPQFKGIPFLIPYYDKLPSWASYLEEMEKYPAREVSC